MTLVQKLLKWWIIPKKNICIGLRQFTKRNILSAKKTWYIFIVALKIQQKINHGGLDSWDQLRSRSRTSLASRLTFLKCRDFLDSRDVGFWTVSIKSLDRDKNKNRDKSRLYSIEIIEICREVIFQTVEKISTVEMSFFKLSRKSRLSRPALCQCRDRESRSRHDRDKSRPPSLQKMLQHKETKTCFSPTKKNLNPNLLCN